MTKLPTGVPGFDVVLGGGLEAGSVMVLAGAPGTGKTTLAPQICFASFDFYDPRLLALLVEHIDLGDFIRSDRPGRMEPMVEEIVRKTTRLSQRPATGWPAL